MIPVFVCMAGAAQAAAPCDGPEFRQFDFWVGEWQVNTPDGKFHGTNRIEREYGGCVIHEHYLTGRGYSGESLNIYDASRKVWHQSWVDNSGTLLTLEGHLIDGRMVLEGDATAEATLLTAGVQQAQGLFAALPNDAANVFVTLTAKELNPRLQVIVRAETEHSVRILRHAGADQVVSPYAIGGHRMAQAALRPAVVDVIDLATHSQNLEIRLEELGVPPQSPCAGMVLRDSGLRERFGVIVVAIKRAADTMIFNPAPEERIKAGDRLVVLAEAARFKAVEEHISGQA